MSDQAGLLDQYVSFLRRHQGLAEGTIRNYQRHVEPFLFHLGQQATVGGLRGLSPAAVRDFIVARATGLGRRSKRAACEAMRSFLRYAHVQGHVDALLVEAVPTIPTYRLERLPRALPWQAVVQILESVDRTCPDGKRDYALLLLLVTYGLRISEVRSLCVDDIDWRHDRICIRQRKGGVPLLLPVTAEVGEALIAYLQEARPSVECREVFVTRGKPHRPFRTSSSLAWIVRGYIERTGAAGSCRGPHALRHSVASRLLQDGHSIKAIADLLGHRSIESAFLYSKIDIEQLREVALDLPEVS